MKDSYAEILLIEDNPNDVELMLHVFRKYYLGDHIEVLRDGEEALDYIFGNSGSDKKTLQQKPKVIFLDLKLPKVDGIEVLRRIKGDERTRSIPVVVLTSSREERDIVESQNLYVNSYIVKPVDFDWFEHVVQQLCQYWLLLNQPPYEKEK